MIFLALTDETNSGQSQTGSNDVQEDDWSGRHTSTPGGMCSISSLGDQPHPLINYTPSQPQPLTAPTPHSHTPSPPSPPFSIFRWLFLSLLLWTARRYTLCSVECVRRSWCRSSLLSQLSLFPLSSNVLPLLFLQPPTFVQCLTLPRYAYIHIGKL